MRYRLWAPSVQNVALVVASDGDRTVAMQRTSDGWFECDDAASRAGTRYWYEIDSHRRVPDPAARFMPEGPHGASEVVDPASFAWADDRVACRRELRELVFYELHVGTFTQEGTYAAAARHLQDLCELGITAVELMPVAQPAGVRNWGYDGVGLYAPAHAYGSPDDLKRFVAEAHATGLCVFLDVVYNHFGPEGNYLYGYAREFFDERTQTPWGAAIDYASPEHRPVRDFAIDNACYWLYEYRFDGLRLDAIETIAEDARFWLIGDLSRRARAAAGRPLFVVVENDRNDAELLSGASPPCDAQWNDDVHHCLHVAMTGETDGYYEDYRDAPMALLGRALTSGFSYQGESSGFRHGRSRGTSSAGVPLVRFITFLQNHDQIGNRAFGERITALAPPEAVKAATAVLLLAPSLPLLFMGQEWGASSPFRYFCDFEPDLARRVTEGRRNEFARFAQFADAASRERIPDPSAARTFADSRLDWAEREREGHREWLELHRTLLRIRREQIVPRIAGISSRDCTYQTVGRCGLRARWGTSGGALHLEANLGASPCDGFPQMPPGRVIFSLQDPHFGSGVAPPWSVRWTLR